MKTDFRHSSLLVLAGLLVLCLPLYFIGLNWLPLLGPDEPRYVEVGREMYLSGDWITPRLAGITWFEKPALLYWLVAASFHLFGVSEFAARVGVAALASAGVILSFLFVRRVRSDSVGLIAASVVASTGFWVGFARGATFDMPLSVAIELALLSFWYWAEREPERSWPLLVSGFALGLAVLAKGLVGILVPGAVVLCYLGLTRRLRLIFTRSLPLLCGVAVFGATAALWYGPMLQRHAWVFIDEFIIAHHFRRYLSDTYRHPQPVYFFSVVALAGAFPWSVWFVGALLKDIKRVRSLFVDEGGRLRLFLWLWAVIPVIFFSFSGSKLPGYILPVFPALGLLVGLEISEAQKSRWRVAGTATLLLIVSIAFAVLAPKQMDLSAAAAWTISGSGAAVAGAYAVFAWIRSERFAALVLSTGLAVIALVTMWLAAPGLSRRESIRDLAAIAIEKARPGERLVFYLDSNQGVNFYATHLPLRDSRSELVTVQHGDQLAPLLQHEGRASLLVMCYERWSTGLFINDRFDAEKLAVQGRRKSCSPGCDWVLLRVSRKAAK